MIGVANAAEESRRTLPWRAVALLALVAALVALATYFEVGARLDALRDWIGGLGVAGPLVFVVIYVAAVVAAVPGSALTLAAGALFGSLWGVVLVSVASTLGAGLSFLIARYFAREAVRGWLAHNERFQKLDRLTETHGAVIVALTRLVPLFPFNLLNYGFGLTRVRFKTYLLWSWLCMLPATVVFVVGGDAVTRTLVERRIPWDLVGWLAGGAVLLAVLVLLARRRLVATSTSSDCTDADSGRA